MTKPVLKLFAVLAVLNEIRSVVVAVPAGMAAYHSPQAAALAEQWGAASDSLRLFVVGLTLVGTFLVGVVPIWVVSRIFRHIKEKKA